MSGVIVTPPCTSKLLYKINVNSSQISRRSTAIEVKWSWDKCRDPLTAATITRVLEIINILDTNMVFLKNADCKADPLKPIYEQIFKAQSTNVGPQVFSLQNSKNFVN